MNTQKGFLLFYDWADVLRELDAESFKMLTLAMIDFQRNVTPPPEFTGTARIIANLIFPQLKRRMSSAEAGRKGMAKRYSTSTDNTLNNTLNNTLSNTLSNHRQDKDKDKDKTKTIPPKSPKGDENTNELEKRFERFWKAYPRHERKQDALKAFIKLKPDEALTEVIINAVEGQKLSKQWATPQYIPHPSTWLNGRRWEDETEEQTQHALKAAQPKNILDDYF